MTGTVCQTIFLQTKLTLTIFKKRLKSVDEDLLTQAHIKLYISFILNIILTNHFVLALVIFICVFCDFFKCFLKVQLGDLL